MILTYCTWFTFSKSEKFIILSNYIPNSTIYKNNTVSQDYSRLVFYFV